MDNNMKNIMKHLENAVTELEKVMQVMLPPEYAIYVDKEQEVHYITIQDAVSMIDRFGNNCMSEMIGKSDFILVYDERKRIVADGNSYLLGEFLVLRSDYGLKGLDKADIDYVITVMAGRMTSFALGPYRILAYQLGLEEAHE